MAHTLRFEVLGGQCYLVLERLRSVGYDAEFIGFAGPRDQPVIEIVGVDEPRFVHSIVKSACPEAAYLGPAS